jgi:hypothetical protein
MTVYEDLTKDVFRPYCNSWALGPSILLASQAVSLTHSGEAESVKERHVPIRHQEGGREEEEELYLRLETREAGRQGRRGAVFSDSFRKPASAPGKWRPERRPRDSSVDFLPRVRVRRYGRAPCHSACQVDCFNKWPAPTAHAAPGRQERGLGVWRRREERKRPLVVEHLVAAIQTPNRHHSALIIAPRAPLFDFSHFTTRLLPILPIGSRPCILGPCIQTCRLAALVQMADMSAGAAQWKLHCV